MSTHELKNLHVPLPVALYELLRAEAERIRRPATQLAREAINHWLLERHRAATYEAIQAYTRETAGTRDDLDPALEAAGVGHLLVTTGKPKRGRAK